jgi:membrane associated rhomboid family serine protease
MVRLFRRLSDLPIRMWDQLRAAPASRWTAVACVAVFLAQRISGRLDFSEGFTFGYVFLYGFGLCPPLLASGFLWQPFTYLFLHGSLLHLLLNTLTLLLFGSGLEIEVGSRRFLRTFFLGGVIGGLAWAGFDLAVVRWASGVWSGPDWVLALAAQALAHRGVTPDGAAICIGASGGIFALIGAYAAIFPRRKIVVFLGWPVSLNARTVAILLGLSTVAFAVYGLGNVAYLTHLFGGLAGYGYGLRLAARRT